MMTFRLSAINKSRLTLFGIATLWIALFHTYRVDFTPLFPNAVGTVLNHLREHGDIGVDIFLLLSGMGLYQAMHKNSSVKHFYINRIKRIVPTLLLTLPVLAGFFFQGTLKSFFYNITSLTYWTRLWDTATPKGLYLWYISFLLLLYALFPLVYRLTYRTKGHGMFILLFLLTIALNAVLILWAPAAYSRIEYGIARFPVFITGAWMGKAIVEEKTLGKAWIWGIISFLGCVGTIYLLWLDDHVFHQLPLQRAAYGVNAICFVLLWSILADRVHIKVLRGILHFIGTFSLPVYILFETLYARLRSYVQYQDETWLVSFLAVFCLTLLLSWLIDAVSRKLAGCFKETDA